MAARMGPEVESIASPGEMSGASPLELIRKLREDQERLLARMQSCSNSKDTNQVSPDCQLQNENKSRGLQEEDAFLRRSRSRTDNSVAYFKLLSPDEDLLHQLFDDMDANKDGLLTKDQVRSVIAKKVLP